MVNAYTHIGQNYWIKVEPVYNEKDNAFLGYVAYVSDVEPGPLFYGLSVKQGGKTIIFGDELTALTNANIIKQAELDGNKR